MLNLLAKNHCRRVSRRSKAGAVELWLPSTTTLGTSRVPTTSVIGKLFLRTSVRRTVRNCKVHVRTHVRFDHTNPRLIGFPEPLAHRRAEPGVFSPN